MPYKILFIKPRVNTKVSLLDIPLGILSLSAYVKKYSRFPIKTNCLDLRLSKSKGILKQTIDVFKPDLIGISLMDCERHFLSQYQSILEKYARKIPIVTGGPYPTCHYETILRNTCISYVIVGEGERSFHKLVQCLAQGLSVNDIKGLAWCSQNGQPVYNGQMPYINNLDEIPVPDYNLIDINQYQGFHPNMNGVLAENRYIHIMSSRACPFHCIFCHNMFGKHVRQRSVKHFITEIKVLRYQYNIKEFHIIDDYFNFNLKRMHAILDEIIDNHLDIKIAFPNALRGDQLEADDIAKLKQAGTYMINFSIETGSKRLQKKIGKKINLNKILHNITIAKQMGIITRGYFMLGFPTETLSELNATINLACKSDLSMVSFFTVIPFQGTKLYEWAFSEYPEIIDNEESGYWSHGKYYSQSTGIRLKSIKKKATIKFYSIRRLRWLIRHTPRKFYYVIRFVHSAITILSS